MEPRTARPVGSHDGDLKTGKILPCFGWFTNSAIIPVMTFLVPVDRERQQLPGRLSHRVRRHPWLSDRQARRTCLGSGWADRAVARGRELPGAETAGRLNRPLFAPHS